MMRYFLAAVLALAAIISTASAQSNDDALVWVQIEAQPSLAEANEALRRRAAQLEDVNGFDLGRGWFAVALGPYRREDANQVLRVLRAEGRIPRDSYIADSEDYSRQIWPVGSTVLAQLLGQAPVTAPDTTAETTAETATEETDTTETTDTTDTTVAEVPILPEPEPVDETPAEARRSERELSYDERAALQIALQWAGHYDGRIDAAFGAGTRRSMASWQEANNYDATGILTTAQRADLLDQYNAVLKGMGLEMVDDAATGIRMKLPLGVVEFSRLEPPFAHYEAKGDIPAKVLLISQEGDQDTLFGLYDIMQTLEIVPLDGPRERKSDSFELIGEGATQISHTVASLKNGRIKGFTLVWPAGDEERRARVLAEMQASFARIDGVLDARAGDADAQSVDLISGLEIRKPLRSRSGFYVDNAGSVVTTTEALEGCGYVTIEDDHRATIAARDDAAGIAVLRPNDQLAPQSVAQFQTVTPRLKSEIAVAGYSFGGVLGAPTLTYGQLEDIRGLNGEAGMKRLALNALDGDAGGPVVDTGGAVLGMLLPGAGGDRVLPEGVSLAANTDALTKILQEAGITPAAAGTLDRLPADALSDAAGRMTVLVSCWE